MANTANGRRATDPVDDGDPTSLENKEARVEMRRENAVSSLPKSAIRKLERKMGARK